MFSTPSIRQTENRAGEDARLGTYNPDGYIVSALGPEPIFDPVGNYRHGQIGSQLQNPVIEETEQDIRREEDELAKSASPHLLIAFVIVLLFMETAGSIYVMRAMGIESPERVIFGTALAVCIFFVTWIGSRARNRVISIAALVALSALVSALTVLRIEENGGDEGAPAVGFASALIMMAVTVGPAIMAEQVLRQLAPVLPVMRRIVRLRRRLRHAIRQQKQATRFVRSLSRRRETWQREAARRRAMYDIAYRAGRAELGDASAATAVIPPWVVPSGDGVASTALSKRSTNRENL